VQLGVELDRSGRVKVGADLEVIGCPNVFALGDITLCTDESGKPLPGLAQVAKQQGIHLGRALANRIRTDQIDGLSHRERSMTKRLLFSGTRPSDPTMKSGTSATSRGLERRAWKSCCRALTERHNVIKTESAPKRTSGTQCCHTASGFIGGICF
jgi:hypothetical protein